MDHNTPASAEALADEHDGGRIVRNVRNSRLGEAGTSRGLVLTPGSDDDGWIIPPAVHLDDGTAIQFFKDGQALHAAYEAIKTARRTICLETYIFHSDDTGNAFADLLCAKSRAGVRVWVIYDSFGSMDTDTSLFERMRQAGVRVAEFHPMRPWDCKFAWRPFSRNHRKLLVIDDHVAGLGGLNIGLEYGSGFPRIPSKSELWRDNAIGLAGPAAQHLCQSFVQTWRYIQQGGRLGKTEHIFNLNLGDRRVRPRPVVGLHKHGQRRGELKRESVSAALAAPSASLRGGLGFLASAPTHSSPLKPFLHKLVREAHDSVDMTIAYFAPSDELIDELCRAARRGVQVRLMLPGRTDVKLLRAAAHAFYFTLLSAGVEIYERQGVVLHAKSMVIDGSLTVIGSTNLDYRSIEYNCELSAVIDSPAFAAQMRNLFEHDRQYAVRIALEQWRARPLVDRVLQWAVSRARYLL